MTNASSSAKIECSCIMLIANTSPYSGLCHDPPLPQTQSAVILAVAKCHHRPQSTCCAILSPCVTLRLLIAIIGQEGGKIGCACHVRPRPSPFCFAGRGQNCVVCRSIIYPCHGLLNIVSWILMSVAERRIVILLSP